jgi:hypothetical protein
VTDDHAERDGDEGGDDQADPRVDEVLEDALRDAVRAGPVSRVGQPAADAVQHVVTSPPATA